MTLGPVLPAMTFITFGHGTGIAKWFMIGASKKTASLNLRIAHYT